VSDGCFDSFLAMSAIGGPLTPNSFFQKLIFFDYQTSYLLLHHPKHLFHNKCIFSYA